MVQNGNFAYPVRSASQIKRTSHQQLNMNLKGAQAFNVGFFTEMFGDRLGMPWRSTGWWQLACMIKLLREILFLFVKRQPNINHHVTRIRPSIFNGKEHQAHHLVLSPPCEVIKHFIWSMLFLRVSATRDPWDIPTLNHNHFICQLQWG